MIRISKSQIVPESLTETQTYDREDVQERLLHDQHRKCYLCERTRTTDFEIEQEQKELSGITTRLGKSIFSLRIL